MVRQFRGRTEPGLVDYFSANFLHEADPGPLWFTSALLLFEGMYFACRFAPHLRDRPPRGYPLPNDRQILLFVLGIGVFTFFFRQWFPPSYPLWHFNLAYFPLYVCMFTFGILARRSGWFETLGAAQANRWYRAALAAIALAPPVLILNVVLGYDEYAFWDGFNWQVFAYAMWEPVLCVGINMKLIVFYRDRVNGTSRLARNMARSSYTAYIFHAFFIVVATYLFTSFSLGRIPEIILMWPVAVIPCFLFADALRRAPALDKIL